MRSDFAPSPSSDAWPLTDRLRHWAVERAHQRALTFVDFPEHDSVGRHRSLTWSQLWSQAAATAARVSEAARPGDRAALLLPQGTDYVAAFLGCLMARVVAVPLFSPDLPGHEGRIAAVLEDCEPACALVTPQGARAAQASESAAQLSRVRLVTIDGREGLEQSDPDAVTMPLALPSNSVSADTDPDEIAYLQYTSGSTRTPAGVMISHRNMVANALQAFEAFGMADGPTTSVGWLPLFHDMGLALSIVMPLTAGFPSVLMDPAAFLERPERWLRLLGQHPGALSAAPNFAYDYCVARTDPGQLADLRLDRVRALVNGSEPVQIDTVRRFHQAFAGTGLRLESLCPSYGLAEATVFVTTDGPGDAPREVVCRRDALAGGHITAAPAEVDQEADREPDRDGAFTSLVSCGVPAGQEVRIVDPASGALLTDDMIGEILVRGRNVGLGYWKRPEQSAETFGARLADTGEQPWLRTGDLGAIHQGRLLVTGRIKDLIIADGRNHYPQDVEQCLQEALDCVRKGYVAVFAVPGEEGELVVAVAEHRRDLRPDAAMRDEADRTARARISAAHGLRLERLVLVPPGSVPRTASGKVSRSACRAAFLRGEYEAGGENGERRDPPARSLERV